MKKIFLLCAIFIASNTYAQKRILVFDLKTKAIDTLPVVEFDHSIASDFTTFEIGHFNQSIEQLNEAAPIPSENFQKSKAAPFLDLSSYPIRTSTKLFKLVNDTLKSLCSGSMVSRKHVLTAAHCISSTNDHIFYDDPIYVCPVYDNGIENPNFECSWVSKIYYFEDWKLSGEDFALLELEQPIGDQTGWISMGFEDNDDKLQDGVFYKFSYPSWTVLLLDSMEYNGDTLFVKHGLVDCIGENKLGVQGQFSIPGESGSSLIKVKNEIFYTTYGVANFAGNMVHSRIVNWIFYAFKNVIIDDLFLDTKPILAKDNFDVFPNPTHGNLYFNGLDESVQLTLFDNYGNKLFVEKGFNLEGGLDISNYPSGVYILNIKTKIKVKSVKVVRF